MSDKAKLYDVIRRPIITEKSTMASENNAVAFEVAIDANKPTIKEAVETLFGVMKVNPVHRARIRKKTILLVDDVMTSGATLAEATNACVSAGAEDVRILVLARVAKDA